MTDKFDVVYGRLGEIATEVGISVEYLTNTKQIVLIEKLAEKIIQDCKNGIISTWYEKGMNTIRGISIESFLEHYEYNLDLNAIPKFVYNSEPKLWFSKRHIETGIVFKDVFSNTNCPNWDDTPLAQLNLKAKQRIDYLNTRMPDKWEYRIIGWKIEKF